MLTRSAELSAATLWRPAAEPRMSCIPAGLQPPARSIRKGFLFAAGSLTALSTIVFARVVRTARRLRRWQEDLAQVLPFPG